MNLPYTDTASKALSVAQEIATKHGNDRIGTAHLLLALLQCGGVAGLVTTGCRHQMMRDTEALLKEITTGK